MRLTVKKHQTIANKAAGFVRGKAPPMVGFLQFLTKPYQSQPQKMWAANGKAVLVAGAIGLMVAGCAGPNGQTNTGQSGNIPILSDIADMLRPDPTQTGLAGTISAPQASNQTNNSGMLIADQPTPLNVGDRFVFDNPEIAWQVIGKSGNAIFWQADNGDTQITDTNPILPALEWKSNTRGSGRRTITGLSANMFPLEAGKAVSFRSSVTSDQPPYSWEFNWNCTTTGQKRITTPVLGAVDAFEIICDRQGQDQLAFYYSPEIGHYVRMEARGTDGFGNTVRNLVVYSRAGSTGGMQQQIGTGPAGQQIGQNQAAGGQAVGGNQPVIGNQAGDLFVGSDGTVGFPDSGGMVDFGALGAPLSSQQQPQGGLLGAEIPQAGVVAGNSFGGGLVNNNLSSPLSSAQQQVGSNVLATAPGLNSSTLLPGIDDQGNPIPGFDMGVQTGETNQRRSLFGQDFTDNPTPEAFQNVAPTGTPAAAPIANNVFAASTGTGGGYLVHLASYRQTQAAQDGWITLTGRHSDILSGYSPVIREVNLPGKGLYQRLFAGSFSNKADADQLCGLLQTRGAYCAVMQ